MVCEGGGEGYVHFKSLEDEYEFKDQRGIIPEGGQYTST